MDRAFWPLPNSYIKPQSSDKVTTKKGSSGPKIPQFKEKMEIEMLVLMSSLFIIFMQQRVDFQD